MHGPGRLTRDFIRSWTPLILFAFGSVFSQTGADTTRKAEVKSPTGAMVRSALVPGWGQVYAGQPLRAVAAFGATAGLAGSIVYYNQKAVRSRSRDERDFYENYRGQMVWWCAAAYFLNVLDAYVDAHLWHFDTGPGLSGPSRGGPGQVPRVGLAWHF
jgi:hypothetical protein